MAKLSREQMIAHTQTRKAENIKKADLQAYYGMRKGIYMNVQRGHARSLRRQGMKAGAKVVNTIKEQIILPIREALMNAKVSPSVVDTKLSRTCIRTLQGNSGIVNMGKGWNASLSLKTYKKLTEQGIM